MQRELLLVGEEYQFNLIKYSIELNSILIEYQPFIINHISSYVAIMKRIFYSLSCYS